jgi:Flp pilus assembly protein TadB
MRTCAICNKENRDDGSFCQYCGCNFYTPIQNKPLTLEETKQLFAELEEHREKKLKETNKSIAIKNKKRKRTASLCSLGVTLSVFVICVCNSLPMAVTIVICFITLFICSFCFLISRSIKKIIND